MTIEPQKKVFHNNFKFEFLNILMAFQFLDHDIKIVRKYEINNVIKTEHNKYFSESFKNKKV